MRHKQIMDKVKSVIDNSSEKQKDIVARYISLANRELNELSNNSEIVWEIVGGSMGLKNRFEKKYGTFIIQSEPITTEAP